MMKHKLSLSLLCGTALLVLLLTSCESIFNGLGYYKPEQLQQLLASGQIDATGQALMSEAAMRYARDHPGTVLPSQGTTATGTEAVTDKPDIAALLSVDYSLVQYLPEEPKRMVWLDDTVTETVDALLPQVATRNDGSGVRYMPQGVTTDNSDNAVYFYFVTDASGVPGPLRLRVQYYADDPLNFEDVEFLVDGFDYHIMPANMHSGSLGSMYWQNCDERLRQQDKDLTYAVSHSARWITMKLHGADGMIHLKDLSDRQRKDFANILSLYRLMGGTI